MRQLGHALFDGGDLGGQSCQSQGYYCALARSSLSMALQWSPNDTALKQALTWLESHNPPYADQAFFRSDPTFNIGKSN